MSFDSRAFRNALGCFPTGVSVVTTVTANGLPVGVTISSFTSLSLEPPLVLFCLDRDCPFLGAFEAHSSFAVNVLSSQQRNLSINFGSSLAGQWQDVAYDTWSSGAPILPGCLASFECTTVARHAGGDHRIFIGRVDRLQCASTGRPLVYFRGAYAELG
jgi:flavin reductase (DIM6/NTAB) family NADH-FMN oxidoreductase RutF